MDKFIKMFGIYNPINAVFEDANAGDANKPNVGGGDAGGKAGQGGGGSPMAPTKPSTVEIIVDGEKRAVTQEELVTLAQKASGAEKRFQEASDLKKQAEDGLRIKGLVDRLTNAEHQPTDAELKELAGMIGADPNEFTQEYKKALGGDEDPPQKSQKTTPSKMDRQALVEALGFDPAEAKQILDFSHQRHIDAAKQQIREMSDNAVDKDEIFGKIKIGESGNDRLTVVKEMVAEDVLRRIQDGKPFGAELVAASVQKIRAHLTKFGIPNKLTEHPVVLGLGPSTGFPAEIQADTPIKRISAAEDGDGDNFIKRVAQKMIKAARSSKE